MKTLVLANQKGGVGKSAVATLLAHYLRRCGKRVLAIDLDHQGNFTSPVVLSKRAMVTTVTSDRVLTVSGTDVPDSPFVLVPAGGDLLGLERQPEQHNTFARNLRAFLKAMDDRFDVCVIDTHPGPDIRLISALCSADFVLSPTISSGSFPCAGAPPFPSHVPRPSPSRGRRGWGLRAKHCRLAPGRASLQTT
jgi:chromosome partitioning protein